jgi:hypothetical protein
MKTIYFNESQLSLIKEAMSDSFSFDELKSIKEFKGKMNYCFKNLGRNFGRGTSRIVFELTDEWVLKLAMNEKGIAQNEEEARTLSTNYFYVFPKIDKDKTDWDRFSFIVVENVLPAKAQDFKQILGISFNEFCLYVDDIWLQYAPNSTYLMNFGYFGHADDRDSAYDHINDDDFLSDLDDYMRDKRVPAGDLKRLSSYGMVLRNGSPQIVVIDPGLTYDIYNKFYK